MPKSSKAETARIEIELWFRDDPSLRSVLQSEVEQIVNLAKGRVLARSVIPGIDYHAVLAELHYDQVELVLENGPGAIQLLVTESIMFISSARPMMIPSPLIVSGPQTT